MAICDLCDREMTTANTCSACGWDEPGGGDEDEAAVLGMSRFAPASVQTTARPPFAAVVAPLRARHRGLLRRLATWSLANGRRCDLDVASLCFEVLDAHRSGDGLVRLDRPTVQQLLYADVWNASQVLGTVPPDQWPVELWTILAWLDAEQLLDPASAPLAVLREPLQCYGGLDETGHPLPEGQESGVACQCYVPYDPTLPSGIGQHIVGHDSSSFEPFLTPARLRTPSEPPMLTDLEPLYLFARRLRRDGAVAEIHVEDFCFVGVAPLQEHAPELWIYRHEVTNRRGGDPLVLDATGHAWRPRTDRRFRRGYRWVAVDDTAAAFRAAGPSCDGS